MTGAEIAQMFHPIGPVESWLCGRLLEIARRLDLAELYEEVASGLLANCAPADKRYLEGQYKRAVAVRQKTELHGSRLWSELAGELRAMQRHRLEVGAGTTSTSAPGTKAPPGTPPARERGRARKTECAR